MADTDRKAMTTQGRIRRNARWPVLGLGILVLLLLGLDAALPPILTYAIRHGLASAGFPEARVGPAYVGWTHAVIEDIALDAGGLNRIHRVEAGISLRALLAGALDTIALDGVRLEIRPFGPGPVLPGWVPQGGEPGKAPGRLVLPVRRLSVRDVAIGVVTPAGPILVAAPDIAIDPKRDGVSASAAFRAEHVKWIATGQATATLAAGKGEARVRLTEAHLPDSPVAIEGFSGQADLGFDAGRLTSAQAEAQGRLRGARDRGGFAFRLAHEPGGEAAEADLHWGAAQATARIQVKPEAKGAPRLVANVAFQSFDPALAGFPAGRLDGKVEASGTATSGRADLRLSADAGGGIEGRGSLGRIVLSGPAAIRWSGGEIGLALPDCVEAAASDVRFRSVYLARVAVHCLHERKDGPFLTLNGVAGPHLMVSSGQIDRMSWVAADHPLELRDLAWTLARRNRVLSGGVQGALHDPAQAPWFLPVTLSARLQGSGRDRLKVALRASQGEERANVEADLTLGPGSAGKAAVRLRPVRFPADSRPAEHDFPILTRYANTVAGLLALSGDFAWNAEGMSSSGELNIRNAVIEASGLAGRGIDAQLQARPLWPPTLAPGQRITIRLLEAGIPVRDLVLPIGLEAGRILNVGEGQGSFAGGVLRVLPFTASLSPPRAEMALEAADLDLNQMLALIGIEGLKGEGKLSGKVPVRIADGEAAVSQARLESREGTIAYDPAHPPQALTQGAASLALKALRNFHYDTLSLTLDGALGRDSRAVLTLQGRNPDLYEGKMIKFTLNISGALDTIVRRGVQAYRLPNRVRERIEFLQRKRP